MRIYKFFIIIFLLHGVQASQLPHQGAMDIIKETEKEILKSISEANFSGDHPDWNKDPSLLQTKIEEIYSAASSLERLITFGEGKGVSGLDVSRTATKEEADIMLGALSFVYAVKSRFLEALQENKEKSDWPKLQEREHLNFAAYKGEKTDGVQQHFTLINELKNRIFPEEKPKDAEKGPTFLDTGFLPLTPIFCFKKHRICAYHPVETGVVLNTPSTAPFESLPLLFYDNLVSFEHLCNMIVYETQKKSDEIAHALVNNQWTVEEVFSRLNKRIPRISLGSTYPLDPFFQHLKDPWTLLSSKEAWISPYVRYSAPYDSFIAKEALTDPYSKRQLYPQGWKLHVAASLDACVRIAQIALPIIEKHGFIYKITRLAEQKKWVQKKDIQAGKSIAIYTPYQFHQDVIETDDRGRERTVALIRELDTALGQAGLDLNKDRIKIAGDAEIGQSGFLFVRYGINNRVRKAVANYTEVQLSEGLPAPAQEEIFFEDDRKTPWPDFFNTSDLSSPFPDDLNLRWTSPKGKNFTWATKPKKWEK